MASPAMHLEEAPAAVEQKPEESLEQLRERPPIDPGGPWGKPGG